MSSIQQRLATARDTRLAFVISAAVNLKAQLCELNELRDQVRKAQLLAPEMSADRTAEKERAFPA